MTFVRDAHYALRTLRKSPMFTLVAVTSLAFGIGANTAIFSLINQVLLQPLPVHDPEQLVLLSPRGANYGSNTGSNAMSYPMYQDIRDHNQVFSGMFCRKGLAMSISAEGKTERVDGEIVSGNFFNVLGIGAALGRVFTASDDLHENAHPYIVISYGYWQSRFAGQADVLGKKLVVDGVPMTIIGVSQKGFESVDPQYEGVAATLGASPLRIFRTVFLPLSWPSLVAGSILCWARALSELGATLVFAGNFSGRTQTMPLAIIGVFDAGKSIDVAIALAVILVVAAAALLLLLRLVAGSAPRPNI